MGTKKIPRACPKCGYKVVKRSGVVRGSAKVNSEWAVMMWWVKKKHLQAIRDNDEIKNKLQKVMEIAKAYWDRHGVTPGIEAEWKAAHPGLEIERKPT